MEEFFTRGFFRQKLFSALRLVAVNGSDGGSEPSGETARSQAYFVSKRIFDIVVSALCLPTFLGLCCVLIALNPIWNSGSLFYLQRRMGKNGKGFIMFKFRSMTRGSAVRRGANDPLETSRITPLGSWMRHSKMDELPQIINVLLGDMSLIGPRPEVYSFAEIYREAIPNYDVRETVKPGMTGYAQVKQGYTDNIEMVRHKTELDAFYVRNMGWRLDLNVLVATMAILVAARKACSFRGGAAVDCSVSEVTDR